MAIKINASKVQKGSSENIPNENAFTKKAVTPAKQQLKLQSFKFDERTRDLLDEIALTLCGGNKTLAIRTALKALNDIPFEQQREALLKVVK